MSSALTPNFANLSPTIPLPTDANALLAFYVTQWQTNWFNNTGQNVALTQSDPVYQMLQTQVAVQVILRGMYNNSFNNGLLPFASGAWLDVLGAFFGLARSQAQYATATLQFTLSNTLGGTIPAGTSVAVTGNSTISFATNSNLVVPAGQTTGTVTATANIIGTPGNGYLAGQIASLQNWTQPFVVSAINTDTSSGGADVESDNEFRAAIFLQSETFTTDGSYGAYRQRAINANPQSIQDATVVGPESGIVTPGQVYIAILANLTETGSLTPTLDLLSTVYNAVTPYNPLTDQVFVNPPEFVPFVCNVLFWSDTASQTNVQTTIASVTTAFQSTISQITTQKLGRAYDPSWMTAQLINAGASRVQITPFEYVPINPWQLAAVASGSGSLSITYVDAENDYLPINIYSYTN